MAWILFLAEVESGIRLFRKDIYLIVEDEKWAVHWFVRKKDKDGKWHVEQQS